MTFDELRQQIFSLHHAGEYAAAAELLAQRQPDFPTAEEQARIMFWRVCFHSLGGDLPAALDTLQAAYDAGHWYGSTWLRVDSDLTPLQGHPQFEALVARFQQRGHDLWANAPRSREELLAATAPAPLLMALHGNNSAARTSVDFWRPAHAHGWHVVLPMSTQAASTDTARWDDDEWSLKDVRFHYDDLLASQAVTPAQVVVGGFSMGGRLALTLGLTQPFPIAGVIAVGPALGDGAERWRPTLENLRGTSVRVCLVIGQEDDAEMIVNPARDLAALLVDYGIACQLHRYPDLGHAFPPDFASLLPEMLDWLSTNPVN